MFKIKEDFIGTKPDEKQVALIEDTIPQIKALIVPWRIMTEDEDIRYSRE